MPAYVFESHGRSWRTGLALLAAWAVLLTAWAVLGVATWILILLGLTTLPALWDLVQNPAAGLVLDDDRLAWHSGRRRAEIPLAEIQAIHMDRRWDLSVRVSVLPHSGRKVRLPAEALPPADQLEAALTARGLKTERHPFSLF